MKYNITTPPSKTPQNIAITIPDLPATVTPVITGTTPIDPVPPANQPPTVNAGQDITITLPINEVILNGSGLDPDGSIVKWEWVKVSGGNASIQSPNSAITKVLALSKGSYVFRLTVTDNSGATKSDDTNVTVADVIVPIPLGSIEGFGSAVTGGSMSGNTVLVNSLTESALSSAIGSGNRVVKFNMPGTVKVRLSFNGLKNITIDGEGKILIDNGYNGDAFAFEGVGCDNIIFKNLRVRNAGNDCIGIRCRNIVIDHCSFDKSGDGLVDMTDNAENITIQYNLFGDSVSGAMLLAYAGRRRISVHNNIFMSWERMPLIHRANNYVPTQTEDLMCEFANNLVWGPWSNAGCWVAYGGTGQFKNNWFRVKDNAIRIEHPEYSKVFASGNIAKGGVVVNAGNHAEWPIPVENRITIIPALDAAKRCLLQSGCRPLDSFDQSLINKITL